jgi:hypothetical protein
MVRLLGLAGCGCLALMLLTHVAERLHVLPGMGWGMPDSPGHYLDLVSAILGFVLLAAAYIVRYRLKRSREPSTKSLTYDLDHAGRRS